MAMSNTSWPDPEQPGVPLNPEQDGWHWISIDGREPECMHWIFRRDYIRVGEGRNGTWWIVATAVAYSPADASKWHYFGPALTPDEVSAQMKAFVGELRADVDAARAALVETKAALAAAIAELFALVDSYAAERNRLQAACNQLRQEAAWRPIDTAPRDMKYILLGHDGENNDLGPWVETGFNRGGWWCLESGGDFLLNSRFEPTHWLPLPQPPVKDKPDA
jgi:hypothetical protein